MCREFRDAHFQLLLGIQGDQSQAIENVGRSTEALDLTVGKQMLQN